MPKNLEKVQIYPKPVKWATLFRANPVIILLQVNSLTLNNLHYIVPISLVTGLSNEKNTGLHSLNIYIEGLDLILIRLLLKQHLLRKTRFSVF